MIQIHRLYTPPPLLVPRHEHSCEGNILFREYCNNSEHCLQNPFSGTLEFSVIVKARRHDSGILFQEYLMLEMFVNSASFFKNAYISYFCDWIRLERIGILRWEGRRGMMWNRFGLFSQHEMQSRFDARDVVLWRTVILPFCFIMRSQWWLIG